MKKAAITIMAVSLFMVTNIAGGATMVQDGSKVGLDYTLTVAGEVIDTSEGKEPLSYVQGQGQIIPGLEKELAGMKVGEEKTVEVEAEDAYGPINPAAVQDIPRTTFPDDLELKSGMMVPLQDNEGRKLMAVVKDVSEESVKLDFNHPLAGKDLTFAVKIVSIQ